MSSHNTPYRYQQGDYPANYEDPTKDPAPPSKIQVLLVNNRPFFNFEQLCNVLGYWPNLDDLLSHISTGQDAFPPINPAFRDKSSRSFGDAYIVVTHDSRVPYISFDQFGMIYESEQRIQMIIERDWPGIIRKETSPAIAIKHGMVAIMSYVESDPYGQFTRTQLIQKNQGLGREIFSAALDQLVYEQKLIRTLEQTGRAGRAAEVYCLA